MKESVKNAIRARINELNRGVDDLEERLPMARECVARDEATLVRFKLQIAELAQHLAESS